VVSANILGSLNTTRAFTTTVVRARDHHFDTLKFVKRLREEGFTEEQAVAMMKVLSDVIEERLNFPWPLPTEST
jgi:predicted DsbA family dithiol-disulfide isomerase